MLAVTCVAQNQALLGLEPVHRGGEAEDAEVAGRGLLVPGRDRAPFLEPAPETFDEVAVVVDVVGAGHGRLVPPGRDRGPCAAVPDQPAEGVRAVAAIADDHSGTRGSWSRSPGASGSSCAWPGASAKATAQPRPSAITHALVPKPPRERPSASRRSRSREVPLFWAHPRPCGAP